MSAVDAESLERLRRDLGGEEAVLADLIDTYLRETPKLLEAADEAIEKRDAARLHRVAHTMKSTASTFGARRLADLCRRIEAATAPPQGAIPPDAATLRAEWTAVRDVLAARRDAGA